MPGSSLSRLAIVVLAAGLSSRMGSRNKLLQLLDGHTLLARTLDLVTSVGPHQIILVTGHDRQAIEDIAVSRPVRTLYNDAYRQGMGTSIAAGVGACDERCDGVFIHLADMPFVMTGTFKALAKAMASDENPDTRVFVPTFEGQRGHPVLFRAELRPALVKLTGDQGARMVVATNPSREVPVDDPGILADIDTPEALSSHQPH